MDGTKSRLQDWNEVDQNRVNAFWSEAVSRPRGSRDRLGKARRVDRDALSFAVRAFGEQLRHVREDADIAASELAAAIGVGVTTVHSWEASRRIPPLHRLVAIAMALRVPFDHLVPEV